MADPISPATRTLLQTARTALAQVEADLSPAPADHCSATAPPACGADTMGCSEGPQVFYHPGARMALKAGFNPTFILQLVAQYGPQALSMLESIMTQLGQPTKPVSVG